MDNFKKVLAVFRKSNSFYIFKSKIFTKFFYMYMLVVMVISISFFFIYNQIFELVKTSAINDSAGVLSEGFKIFNSKMLTIQNTAVALRNDINFTGLAAVEADDLKTSDYSTMVKAQKFMKSVLIPTEEMIDCFFVFKKNDIILSRDTIYDNVSTYFHTYYPQSKGTLDTWFNSIEKKSIPDRDFFLSSESTCILYPDSIQNAGNKAISYSVVLPGSFKMNADSEMVCILSVEKVLKLMSTQDILDSGFVYMVDHNGRMILNHHFQGDPYDMNGQSILSTTYDGVKTTLVSVRDNKSGLRVVAGIPDKVFYKRIQPVLATFFTYFIAAVLAGLFLSLWFAYRNSIPVRRLLTTAGNLINDSGKNKNEYEIINSSLIKLNTIKENYYNEVINLSSSIKASLFENLLREKSYAYEDRKELDKHLGFVEKPYVIAVIKLGQSRQEEENPEAVKIGLSVILNSLFGSEVYIHNLMKSKTVVLIPLTDSADPALEMIRKKLHQVLIEEQNSFLAEARAGISQTCIGYGGIHEGYEQAMEALRLENGGSSEVAYIYANDEVGIDKMLISIDDVQRLYGLILSGDFEKVCLLLDTVYEAVKEKGIAGEDKIRRLYYNIQNVIYCARNSIDREYETEVSFHKYSAEKTLKQLFAELKENAEEICKLTEMNKKSRNIKLKEDLIQYLRENFTNPNISACLVSDTFNISEKYLYAFIKEQTGMSFGDYVERLRLELATELLRQTEESVGMIAEKVGFNSQNTFQKVFKRFYGISPGLWRSQSQ